MVHQYKLNGYNIVLDTCSGSVHVVDEVAYDVIAMYKSKSAEEIVSELLSKYSHRDDVSEEELYLCIEDVAALEKLEKLVGRDEVIRLIDETAGEVITFKSYPRNSEFLLKLRRKVNEQIEKVC